MGVRRVAGLLALALWVGGCAGEPAANNQAAAPTELLPPGSASTGEMALRRPSPLERKLIPPGAAVGADPDVASPVLVFSAEETPERLLEWVRGTANGADFVLESEMQEGAEHVFLGRAREGGASFMVRLAPGVTGGTTGTIMIDPRG